MRILTLNIGSSTVKYAVFEGDGLELMEKKTLAICHPEQGEGSSLLLKRDSSVALLLQNDMMSIFKNLSKPDVIIHRIVHGGDKFIKPTLLTDEVLNELEKFLPFAPLHQPYNLDGVHVLQNLFEGVPQYGCFDTAFHAGHDELHAIFAIPADLRERNLKRYGFHGLSYDWISRQISAPRMVVAHLGSGASLCAMQNGKSIDSTMGLTALDGLPMATRSGSIDAGLILYLSQHLNYTPDQIEKILYFESGLKGLSGISGDIKTLLSSSDPRAKFAIDYFTFKTAQHIAMMAVSLGGLDSLIFTGGIGENAESIRTAILNHLSFLPAFETHVIKTNEEKMMAIQVQEVLRHA